MLCRARGTQLRPLVGTLVAICPPLSFLRNKTLLLGSEMKRRTSFYSTSKNLHLNGRFWLAMGTISLFIGWYFGAGSGCGDFRGGSKRKGISHLMIPTWCGERDARAHTHKHPIYDSNRNHFHVFIHTHTYMHTYSHMHMHIQTYRHTDITLHTLHDIT